MEFISDILDFTPVSPIKSGIEFFTGYDPITFKKLGPYSRAASGLGMIPFGKIPKYGKTIDKYFKVATKSISINYRTRQKTY